MKQNIISILVAASMVVLATPQVAADNPGLGDLGDAIEACQDEPAVADQVACAANAAGEWTSEVVEDCQNGAEPCDSVEPGYTDVYFEGSSCAFACTNPQGFTIIPGEEPAIDKDTIVLYYVKCRVSTILIDEVSLDGGDCPVGDIECDSDCGRIVGLPPEDVDGVEQVPDGAIPITVASICTTNLWVWVDGDDRVAGEPVFVPCAAT